MALLKVVRISKIPYGNRWETVNSVGEGGQSHVFLVKDLNGESEHCILKRLKNFDRIERFKKEIKAGQELEHPNIAPILDYSLDPKPAYFVTKYYRGKTLTEIAPLEPLHALAIFADICDTIAYAHEKGVFHRDLKPDNIILEENKKPIILDFGICHFVDDDNRLTETSK
ncbi:MAG: protein kinase [Tatlockia sp.]|nr:protein kinase [Tatlockia sp.]